MYNTNFQQRKQKQERISRLRLSLILLFPVITVLFGRDLFALWTPLVRLMPADLLAGVIILTVVRTKNRISLSPLSWALVGSLFAFGLVGFATLAYLNTVGIPVSNGRALVDIIRYPLYATTVACSASVLRTRLARERYLQTLIAVTVLATLVGLAQFLAIQGVPIFERYFMWDNIRGFNDRVGSTFRLQGPLTLWYGVLLPIIAALAVMTTDRTKYYGYLALFGGGVLVALFSGSRSGLLVLPLATVPFLIDVRDHTTQIAALGGIGAVIVAVILLQAGAVARLVRMMTALFSNPSGETRFAIWASGVSSWWSTSPVFGVGPRHFVEYSVRGAHNSYLAALVERGIFGFAIILAFVAIILRMAFQLVRERATPHWPLHVALAAGLLNYLGYLMIAEGLTYRIGYVYLVFVLAVYDVTMTERITLRLQDIRFRLGLS